MYWLEKTQIMIILKIFPQKLIFYGDIKNLDSIHDAIRSNEIIFHVAADYRLWARKKI